MTYQQLEARRIFQQMLAVHAFDPGWPSGFPDSPQMTPFSSQIYRYWDGAWLIQCRDISVVLNHELKRDIIK